MQLAGRTALVTGASRGLGKAIAADFVRQGADVMLVARDAPALRQATEDLLLLKAAATQKVLVHAADVSQPDQVGQVVHGTLEAFGRLDILVCSAGVQGPIGLLEDLDWHEWTRALEVNLFGTVLFCRAVVPSMRLNGHGKIIVLSGGGATRARPRFTAYAASKAALVRFAETLAEELDGSGVDVNAVAPGMLDTHLHDEIVQAGPLRAGEREISDIQRGHAEGMTPLEVPVGLVTFLASSASDGISGRLLAAKWDAWQVLPAVRADLANSDAYRLRRVEPVDRGWGVS